MQIRQIHLINFQNHADLELSFSNNVNIIYGKSDAGKSSIRRSIEWCIFNQKIDGIRKSGTKQTSVLIEFDNGIQIERIKSTSINRYNLRKDKESEIITFDSVGKEIPDEIKSAIGIEPIEIDDEKIYLNSFAQISLPFLFERSPSTRMKLFNKLTGNDILDKLFVSFNKDLLGYNKQLKELKETINFQEIDTKEKETYISQRELLLAKVKKTFQNVKHNQQKLSNILKLFELYKTNSSKLVDTFCQLKQLDIPEHIDFNGLRLKIDKLNALKTMQNRLNLADSTYKEVVGQYAKVNTNLPYEIEEFRGKIDQYEKIQQLLTNNEKNGIIYSKVKKQVEEIETEILNSIDNQKRLLKELKICPTCKREITEECIGEIIK